MLNFKKLIDPQFLFTIDRIALHRSDKIFLVIGAGSLLLGILAWVASRYSESTVDERLRARVATVLLWFGGLEIVWFGARYQYVRFFGVPAVAIVIALGCAIWLIRVLIQEARRYKADKAQLDAKALKEKYLPQAK